MVDVDHNTKNMPGYEGTVGYHTDDGIIFHDYDRKETKGIKRQ